MAANSAVPRQRVAVQAAALTLKAALLITSAGYPSAVRAQERCAVSIEFLSEVAEALKGEVVALRAHVSRLSQKTATTTGAVNAELVSRYGALLAEAEGFERNLADEISRLKSAGDVPAAVGVCRVQPQGDGR
jgi:hypothetical protein